jgi:hypothetical protein
MTIAAPILTFSRSSVTSTANDIIIDINAYMAAYVNNTNLKRQVFSGRRKPLNISPTNLFGGYIPVVAPATLSAERITHEAIQNSTINYHSPITNEKGAYTN